jgi:ABC-type anion transport system duplicated permease subunit
VNPAVELLLAYLKKAQERNAELKAVADNLRSELNYARKSRDAWKLKAKQRRLALKAMTASRDLWRHRAMTRQKEESHEHQRELHRAA